MGQSGENPFNIVPGKKVEVVTPTPEKKIIPEAPAAVTPVKEDETVTENKSELLESKPVIVPEIKEAAAPEKEIESPAEELVEKEEPAAEIISEPEKTEVAKTPSKSSYSNNPFDIKAGSNNKKVIVESARKKQTPKAEVKEIMVKQPSIPNTEITEKEIAADIASNSIAEEKKEILASDKIASDDKPLVDNKAPINIKEDEKGIVKQLLVNQSDSGWNDRYMLYGILLFIMVALTLIINMNRRFISKIYKAAGNENVAKLSFREYQSGSNLQYYLSYALFIINMSIFIYLLLTSLGAQKNLINLFLSFAAILGVYIVRHGVLSYMGMIFPLKKEVSFYSFNIFLYNILFGMVLIPINAVLVLGPQSINKSMLVTGCLIFFIFFIFRQLRGLSIGRSYLKSNQFHFFTYLCSVEIAPILILIKYLMS